MDKACTLLDLAHEFKGVHREYRQSLVSFVSIVPEMGAHIEPVEERNRGTAGKWVKTYSLDPLAVCAFLYWRMCKGRLPRFVCAERRAIKGGVSNGR